MKEYTITVNGTAYQVTVEERSGSEEAPVARHQAAAVPPAPAVKPEPEKTEATEGRVKIVAPMPGKILAIKASSGEPVKKNQVVLILESMKMENEIVSPEDGTVASVAVREGETVEAGKVLITLR